MAESAYFRHGLRALLGRNANEQHRAATPLELLFDLTFVAAFGVAGGELAHGVAEGHALPAAIAFCFAMVAILWAWISYTWFASAFDNDDWLFRLLTMVQMAGVVVLAIGLPTMFASIEHGGAVHNETMVAGYVVMRVAVLVQWVRVVRNNPQYRVVGKTYIACITVAQTGWVLILFLPLDALSFAIFAIIVLIIDWAGPSIADAKAVKHGSLPLPWNAHHVAERYSLLAIIALGETVFGTLAAAQSITKEEGWSVVSVTVIGLGVIMTFALWWVYFMVPSAPILAVRRDKARPWSFGHMAVFASIAAIGAGLHVIGYVYDSHYHVSVTAAIVAIAVPVLGLMLSLYSVHAWLVSAFPRNSPLQLGVL